MKKKLKRIMIALLVILLIFIFDYIRINIRYYLTKGKYEVSFKVNGNKDGYVPQGLTYSNKHNVVLQTSYSKEVSKIFVTDFNSGSLIKELKLYNKDGNPNNKHVGGITTNDDIVWISNDYELDIYSLDEIINTSNDYISAIEEKKIPNRGDFCYYSDNILWVGDFYLRPFYDVKNHDPKLYGYLVDGEIDFNNPNYSFSLPKAVQGMVILPNKEFVFTQSFTYLVNSNLSFYKNILDSKDVKFNKNNKIKTIKIAPMAEGMFYKDGYIYILFESSSSKYKMADPKATEIIKFKIEE